MHITSNHTNMYMHNSLSFPEGMIHVAIDSCFLSTLMGSMSFNSTDNTSSNLKFYTPAQDGIDIVTRNGLLTTIASYKALHF